MKRNVWFVAAEAVPFIKVGGLADVVGELSNHLHNEGYDITICLPYHGLILGEVVLDRCIAFEIHGESENALLYRAVDSPYTVYFISDNHWFGRPQVYGYHDDVFRYAFFCRAVFALLENHENPPQILHLHDWHAAPLALLLKTKEYKGRNQDQMKGIKSLLTIHSLEYQGRWNQEIVDFLTLPKYVMQDDFAGYHGDFNFLKAGISSADGINTVSRTFSQEILKKGFGLEKFLLARKQSVPYEGILNGIDITRWNPWKDKALKYPYNQANLHDRKKNMECLRREMCLYPSSLPLMAFIGRFTHSKGIDKIIKAAAKMAAHGCQTVILGMGDRDTEDRLLRFANDHFGFIVVRIAFDSSLARRIYAGADIFLMPSSYEPCGITQQIAMRYGCLPVVHKTGGLADTVKDLENGFVYLKDSEEAFVKCVQKAVKIYKENQDQWKIMQVNALKRETSWVEPGRQYENLYEKLLLN
jgi:starch synthase